jgi:Sel1 repeat
VIEIEEPAMSGRSSSRVWRFVMAAAAATSVLFLFVPTSVFAQTRNLFTGQVTGTGSPRTIEDSTTAYNEGNYATAYRLLRPLADQGNASAQARIGQMYLDGRGVPRDYAEALKWFRKAADQGFADAQNTLGSMYSKGRGVPPDYAEAMKWFRKAADQGSARAQLNLASKYIYGHGVPKDYVQAYMWLNLAISRIPVSETGSRDMAIKERNLVASKMTPAQIAEAQELTRWWMPRSPQTARFEDCIPPTRTGAPMKKVGGTFVVPIEINGAMTLDFTIDSGAADVSVPLDVFSTLRRQGTIEDADITGRQTYVLADGSTQQTFTFTIGR